MPTQSLVCMHLLEEHIDVPDLLQRVSFMEFKVGLIAYDTDLLSLEMDAVFKQVGEGCLMLFLLLWTCYV